MHAEWRLRYSNECMGLGPFVDGLGCNQDRCVARILGSLIFVYGIAQIFQFAIAQLEIVSGILFLISMVWLGVVLLRSMSLLRRRRANSGILAQKHI